MRGVKKLENHTLSTQPEQAEKNTFLIDWLTFVSHDDTVGSLKKLLGLDGPDIPWEEETKFRNGYPKQCYWNSICISYGADDARFYDDPSKVRYDMGICVNLSGQGCRAYESYGANDWMGLLSRFYSGERYKITRLDMAYDDFSGVLNIHQIEKDVKDRYYISKAKKAEVVWSDNQEKDIKGLSIYIGSKQSNVLVRIYDKAAERGFSEGEKHWIRVEIQLRQERALAAGAELVLKGDVGLISAGILSNYVRFVSPLEDTNKSRWPTAEYWEKLINGMSKISLWISPGEPYNFTKTECWLSRQCGYALLTYSKIHNGLHELLDQIKIIVENSEKGLPKKYLRAIETAKLEKEVFLAEQRKMRAELLYQQLIMEGVPEEWLQDSGSCAI